MSMGLANGSRKHQSPTVTVLGYALHFYFTDYGWEPFGSGNKVKDGFRYGFTWGHYEENDRYRSRAQANNPEYGELTPDVLRSLINESIIRAEENIRSLAESHYKGLIRRREEYIQQREQRRLAAIRRHEKEVKQLLQTRMDLMDDASVRIGKADRLRSLIAAFDEKAAAAKQPIAGYDKWRRWALQQVNQIDLRSMSAEHFGQWIAKFHLHE